MATLNMQVRGTNKTYNRSGHAAYKLDAKTRLVTMALATMLGEPKYYGDTTSELIVLARELCRCGEGRFVAQLAVWARRYANLRSVSHALLAVVSHECSGCAFVRRAVRAVASMRGDDGTEILAAHMALYGRQVRWPHALQRGVRDALEQMSAYELAKYQSPSREVKLRDTLRITHPVPRDAEAAQAMRACVEGTLAKPKGWETELSARGNTAEVWNELIAEHRLGYMASLRNLRNMMQAGAECESVLSMLSDPKAVRASRQLPFRFFSAWRELKQAGLLTTSVSRALDHALEVSCQNVGRLAGRTAVLIDTSASMGSTLSMRSRITCRDVAAVLGAIVARVSDDAWVCAFDSTARQLAFGGASVLADIQAVPASGWCTHMDIAFDLLMMSGFDADRVVVVSDYEVNGYRGGGSSQTIQHKLEAYRKKVGHDVWCHAIDLQGYGTQQFIGRHVNVMAGWSDQMLRFVRLAEEGFGGMVEAIEALEL